MLKVHHIGCAVKNIESSIELFSTLFGAISASDLITVKSQLVKVCFIELPSGYCLELIEPTDSKSPVQHFLEKRCSFYHLGLAVSSLDNEISRLRSLGYGILSPFYSEAFEKQCCFVLSPQKMLFELCEIGE